MPFNLYVDGYILGMMKQMSQNVFEATRLETELSTFSGLNDTSNIGPFQIPVDGILLPSKAQNGILLELDGSWKIRPESTEVIVLDGADTTFAETTPVTATEPAPTSEPTTATAPTSEQTTATAPTSEPTTTTTVAAISAAAGSDETTPDASNRKQPARKAKSNSYVASLGHKRKLE